MTQNSLLFGLDGSVPGGQRHESRGPTHRQDGEPVSLPSWSDNPLVAAADKLLNLLSRIPTVTKLDDPGTLRERLLHELRAFEQRALAANVSREEVIGARYCLCTALDEMAAQTPWGSQGVWGRHSLLVTFHNETWGGEKYYQLLARLAQNPERHHNLIELLYYCNALGFEGKFRVVENGHSQLEILKRRVAGLLGAGSAGYDRRLSPHWEGVATTRDTWRLVPAWVVASICAFLAFLAFMWFVFSLAPPSDALFARLAGLDIPRPELKAVSEPPPPRLRRFLEAEIRARMLEVEDLADRSVITLVGDGLFDSGSVDIQARYLPVFARIVDALNEVGGSILVSGYTDSRPMRSVRFPSNWHLSEARARAVGELLDARLAVRGRVRTEGRGEADPVASNDTAEGRARNRRVVLTLMLSAEEIHRQINVAALPAAEAAQ
ncbi:DotU family type VI secretion system protein [Azoarcus sp. L1K30]|uniref:DotU family type VI secretion system protein n=1 Tax=Azoarcus sp. L1K30 TaxID=2820277 RepID=UPI001B824E28|nr:DotU family type VI secretion system protein [Azoarcus sp. L1K30]